ncbi:patatin-like phospholipase family protein [Actinomycetospora cinnamomea]|uniref:NTE family protein n=1 Tax=Actinomycetospora cinnamomea TaxID=663609 RepID=A0A2U1FQ88_9PSEU|nr:patatin-like phospholipase family protein [Actinomycetospora cinnamomea]PVZ14314.1 NTE family protein [Actinomycetospora cinnamomea]
MTADAPSSPVRALVLGGGGLAGIAWEVGVLVGLAEAGVNLSLADRVVGTSAGSVVGALLTTGVDLAAVHEEHLNGRSADTTGRPAALDMEALGAEIAAAMSGARDAGEMRARLGTWALSAETPPESERRAVIDVRLPVKEWPATDLRISAVDAETGELAVFTRDARVTLVDAVAASCAVPGVWPPMTAGRRRYMDGGVASVVHVARADDDGFEIRGPADRVLVVAPLDPPAGGPFRSVAQEIEHRQEQHPDTDAVAIVADEESVAAFGTNVLDPSTMPASARAGRAQGRAAADEVARRWV